MKKPLVTLEETYLDKANKTMDKLLLILGVVTVIVVSVVMIVVS